MMQRRHAQLPSVVAHPLDDVWSVLIPAARTNEISNPSLETNTTGYTTGAGSLARSTAQQYHGAYSAAYTPSAATTDGLYYTFISTVALRAVSCKFLGQKGVPYALAYASTAPSELVTYTFVATGRWQWIWLYVNETSATSRRIYFRKNGSASVAPFYVDGVQSEALSDASARVSTYIDGDQLGLIANPQTPAFVWNGTPHASTSSRSGLTRAGGTVFRFRDYGFILATVIGLGLAPPQNTSIEYGRIDGGYDDYTRKPTRQFTLAGRVSGRSYSELRSLRSAIADPLDRDASPLDQRLVLTRTVEGLCGDVQTTTARVVCKYQGGLEGNTDNHYAEQLALTFVNYQPMVMSDGESGAALTVQQNVSNANYIQVLDTTTGLWSAVSSGTVNGATGDVNAIVVAPDGKVYIGGVFALASGVANTVKIAYYDPTDGLFHPLGTGATGGNVSWLAMGPDGVLYAAGSFTSMGGVANTNNIAKWNGTAWSALGTGVTAGSGILAMTVDSSNNLFVGGTFTTMGGVANTLRLAKWDGSVWTPLGTGANDTVRSLTTAPGGTLYIGGDFTAINGTAALRVASWNGSAITALGAGMDNGVYALGVGPNNILYAGGAFTTAGGSTALRAAYWNGVSWFPMGGGFNTTVQVLTVLPDGSVYFAGGFTSSGGVTLRSPVAKWNGSSFVGIDNNLVSTVTVQAITPDRGGKLYVGYSSFGTANQAGLTSVVNPGSARSYPVITINGPSSGTARIYAITNPTTGRQIALNLTLVTGEIATLSLQPDNISFVSSFRGSLMSTILPGSNSADFFLAPGANTIAFLSASTTVVATLHYNPLYVSLDDVP